MIEAKGIESLLKIKNKFKNNEKEYLKHNLSHLLLLEPYCTYSTVISDVEVQGYFSDIASQRLRQQYLSEIQVINNRIILTNANILGIRSDFFLKRKEIPELRDMEIEGNIYKINNHLYTLIFPIDLIFHKHIKIKKWKI